MKVKLKDQELHGVAKGIAALIVLIFMFIITSVIFLIPIFLVILFIRWLY